MKRERRMAHRRGQTGSKVERQVLHLCPRRESHAVTTADPRAARAMALLHHTNKRRACLSLASLGRDGEEKSASIA
jgi:hypothetical protein